MRVTRDEIYQPYGQLPAEGGIVIERRGAYELLGEDGVSYRVERSGRPEKPWVWLTGVIVRSPAQTELMRMFGEPDGAEAKAWLNKPASWAGGLTPAQLLEAGRGEEVRAALIGLGHGNFL